MDTYLPSFLCFAATAACCALPFSDRAAAATNATTSVNTATLKEPAYQSTPKYSLITFGTNSDVRVWMVEDGKRLYVDRNANGDLTDDGGPIEPSKVRDLGDGRWDFEYQLPAITPANGARHTDFVLRRWNYNDPADEYGLSLSVDGQMPMYAGWFGTFWSTNREQTPVIHFGGPFTPTILRRDAFTLGETHERMSVGFFHRATDSGAESRLSIDALPRIVVPNLTIEWPAASGHAPLLTAHQLTQRCCYWEFYTTDFELPKGVVPGQARITVDLPANPTSLELTTNVIILPVVAAGQKPHSDR